MEQLDKQDVARLNDLLHRTGEFIAYFELAESKMMEWRQTIEQNAQAHEVQFQQQLQALQMELGSLQEMFTAAGLATFRKATDNALQQAQQYLNAMQETKTQFFHELVDYKTELNQLHEQSINQLNDYTTKSLERIDSQLAHYDPRHFSRIANESCSQVEKSAKHAITVSNKLLRRFEWRAIILTFATSLLTAFAIGLYVSDELPWEIHQHVMNERGAGKLLISAWPKLSYQEKVKIIGEQS